MNSQLSLLAGGFFGAALFTRVYHNILNSDNELERQFSLNSLNEPVVNDEQALALDTLGKLALCNNIRLRESAIRILLARACQESTVREIIAAVCDLNNPLLSRQAISAIEQMSKNDESREKLLNLKAHKQLCKALLDDRPTSDYRSIVVSLYRIVANSGYLERKTRMEMIKIGVLTRLISFLETSPTHTNDLKYWCLFLIHQLSLSDECHKALIDAKVVQLLGEVCKMTFGNASMQKLCLHSLVRLVSSMNSDESKYYLVLLLEENIVPVLAACLKNDDLELVSWAVFLVHEYVIKDVSRPKFAKIRGLLKILISLVNADENGLSRIALKTLKCLGMSNLDFLKTLIKKEVVDKIIGCLKTNDEETQYWALALLHDLMFQRECHTLFNHAKGPECIIRVCETANIHSLLYIADILVYMCTNPVNIPRLANTDVSKAILILVKSQDLDIQYAGVTLALNLVSLSEKITESLYKSLAINTIAQFLFDSERFLLQVATSKTLSTMGKRPNLQSEVVKLAFQPLVCKLIHKVGDYVSFFVSGPFDSNLNSMNSMSTSLVFNELKPNMAFHEIKIDQSTVKSPSSQLPTPNAPANSLRPSATATSANSSAPGSPDLFVAIAKFETRGKSLQNYFECFNIFIRKDLTSQVIDAADIGSHPLISTLLQQFSLFLIDILVLSLVHSRLSEYVKKGEFDIRLSEILQLVLGKPCLPSGKKAIGETSDFYFIFSELNQVQQNLVADAVSILPFLCVYPSIKQLFIKERLVDILVQLFDLNSGLNVIMETLYYLLNQGFNSPSILTSSTILKTITSKQQVPNFFKISLLEKLVGNTSIPLAVTRTSNLLLSPQQTFVSNRAWTFESVRFDSFCVSEHGKYSFEVVLLSEGVIQIGWASSGTKFEAEGGSGVGDDNYSYSYDGLRQKIWHGTSESNGNSYGISWKPLDVITCTLDLTNSTISYSTNGQDHGIAFRNIDVATSWYPAVSVSCDQTCQLRFGSCIDKIQYLNDSLPIYSVLDPEQYSLSLNSIESASVDKYFRMRIITDFEDLVVVGIWFLEGPRYSLVSIGSTTFLTLSNGPLNVDDLVNTIRLFNSDELPADSNIHIVTVYESILTNGSLIEFGLKHSLRIIGISVNGQGQEFLETEKHSSAFIPFTFNVKKFTFQ